MVSLVSVSAPPVAMAPPPIAPAVKFPESVLFVTVTAPPRARPPPRASGPCAEFPSHGAAVQTPRLFVEKAPPAEFPRFIPGQRAADARPGAAVTADKDCPAAGSSSRRAVVRERAI